MFKADKVEEDANKDEEEEKKDPEKEIPEEVKAVRSDERIILGQRAMVGIFLLATRKVTVRLR